VSGESRKAGEQPEARRETTRAAKPLGGCVGLSGSVTIMISCAMTTWVTNQNAYVGPGDATVLPQGVRTQVAHCTSVAANPPLIITALSVVGTTATVTTSTPHGLTGSLYGTSYLVVSGCMPSGYNLQYDLLTKPCTIISPTEFTYQVASGLGTATALGTVALPWSFMIDGFVTLGNDNPYQVEFLLALSIGGYPDNNTNKYKIAPSGILRLPFTVVIAGAAMPFGPFLLYITPTNGPLTCRSVGFVSTEHD